MGGRRRDTGLLSARPQRKPSKAALAIGLNPMGLAADRDAWIFVPSATATKLIVGLHGATGAGERFMKRMQSEAEAIDAIVIAPSSRGGTWDAIMTGGFGDDVPLIDRALAYVFERAPIDRNHVCVAGFSDGATYALSLGLTNGDLFTHVIAYSPGFIVSPEQRGRPRVFISHGTEDDILPIERCGRPIANRLSLAGYTVHFREFDGGHSTPPDVVSESMKWFAR